METSAARKTGAESRILLVVDDEPEICKLIERSLRGAFDEIHTATAQSDAELVLEQNPVTHIVCDFYLATGDTLGDRLLAQWRESWPNIEYAALFTGSTIERHQGHEMIDNVYLKPGGFNDLVKKLRQSSP